MRTMLFYAWIRGLEGEMCRSSHQIERTHTHTLCVERLCVLGAHTLSHAHTNTHAGASERLVCSIDMRGCGIWCVVHILWLTFTIRLDHMTVVPVVHATVLAIYRVHVALFRSLAARATDDRPICSMARHNRMHGP